MSIAGASVLPSLPLLRPLLRRAAVLGAGAMGSRIAAHLANAGLPVVLLDRVLPDTPPDGTSKARSSLAANAVAGLLKAKPAAFYDASCARLITVGNFEDDLALLKDCDWIIEAVTEDLAIKQDLLARIEPYIRGGSAGMDDAQTGPGRTKQGEPGAIVTTNTSGLPIAKIVEKMSPQFRRRWFGTHFFNPPRYMRLLEIIPTADSDPAAVAAVADFADRRLGKTVVYARDTPNFIANRIGVFAMLTALDLMQQQGLTVEEVDALTGAVIGWPRMGTFRLADMVGIDVLAHVARNFAGSRSHDSHSHDASMIALPAFVETMLERGWTGDKAGQGFYKKAAGNDGARLALDWRTLDYRAAERPKFPMVEMAKNADSLPERLRLLLSGDRKKDSAAAFLFPLLTSIWNYAADVLPEIADSAATIDQAMHMGFNWELGPFAMWDAAGVAATVARQRTDGAHVSPQVEALLASGKTAWYSDAGVFDPAGKEYQERPDSRPPASAASFRRAGNRAGNVIRENPGCALLDIGEEIALIELRSKKNAIGDDIISLVTQTLNPDGEPVRNFRGFVIGGDASDFSVGANLMQLLLSIQEGEWDEVDFAVRGFQRMTAGIRFCPRPVVAAPFNLCLGGGAEICLHAAARQAHAELYMGLVEAGVGLVPAGGGSKEMALRASDAAQASSGLDPAGSDPKSDRHARSPELQDALRRRFETMAMAKVSTSAAEAKALDLLKAADGITPNRDRLLLDARAEAVRLAEAGYAPPVERTVAAAGSGVLATLKVGVHHMRKAEYISEHDAKVAGYIAHILCGGEVTPGTPVSEQYFLELEREAFLSLGGEPKTQERIAYTLRNGKPLRN